MPPKKKAPVKEVPKVENPPLSRTRGRQMSAAKDEQPSKKVKKDESESQPKPKTEPKKTKSDLSASKDRTPAKEPVKQEDLKKVILKGGAPVDQYVPGASNYKVYSDGVKTYSVTLNQSNIMANNNKFYIIQILQNESSSNLLFFTRWGRVGVPGQQAAIPCGNAAQAIYEYNKKLRDKSSGGYREVEMNYDDDKKDSKI